MMMIEFNNLPGTQQVLSQPPAQHQPAAWPGAAKKIEKSSQSLAKGCKKIEKSLQSIRRKKGYCNATAERKGNEDKESTCHDASFFASSSAQ